MDKHDAQIMGFLNEVHGEMYCQSCLGAVDKEPRETCMQPDWHEALASGAKGTPAESEQLPAASSNVRGTVDDALCDVDRFKTKGPWRGPTPQEELLAAEVRRLRKEVRDKDVAYIEAIDSQEAELRQLREENARLKEAAALRHQQIVRLSAPRYSTEAVDALLNEVEYRCTEDSGPWCAAQAVRASREPRS